MKDDEHESGALIERIFDGEDGALAELLEHYRPRLELLVRLRMDTRVRGRFDVSDVLQEAFLRAASELARFRAKRHLPVYLWLRSVTAQTLWRLHRHHLGADMRDAGRGVSIDHAQHPHSTSVALASKLVGDWTSPSQRAMRAEARALIAEALESMEPIDREILTLRHLEELSNREAALELGVPEPTARKRHLRAIERLRKTLDGYHGSERDE